MHTFCCLRQNSTRNPYLHRFVASSVCCKRMGESASRIFTDGYLESFQLGFVYKPLPETKKGIEILLANSWNIRVTYSTERWWVVVLHPPSGITCHFNRSRNFVPPSRASRRMGNLPPRFRGRVHALDTLDVGLERVEKMEGGGGVFHRVLSQAKVLALSRHRVLRGDGT